MNTIQARNQKIVLIITIIIILLSIGKNTAIYAEEPIGDCENGLIKCTVSCGPAFFYGLEAGAACELWCVWGYLWCLSYYE